MAERELSLREIAQRLPAAADATHVPAADLWPRIAAAHRTRQRRRRMRRLAAFAIGLSTAFAAAVLLPGWFAQPAAAVDWQARAQALEMQLSASPTLSDASNAGVLDAELARVDIALQAAYDRGAQANELIPLWKQRSELLSALLAARQQQLTLTRI